MNVSMHLRALFSTVDKQIRTDCFLKNQSKLTEAITENVTLN